MNSRNPAVNRQIGILGGTFDPIHNGHLAIAAAAMKQLRLDLLLWIPNAQSPLKPHGPKASFEHRCAMIGLAIEGVEGYKLSKIEGCRGGTSYMVDTLHELQFEYRESAFYLILGADALAELHLWRQSDEIRRIARIVYMARPGRVVSSGNDDAVCLDVPPIDVSSTQIRDLLSRGLPVDAHVPPAVAAYLRSHRLYSS